MKSRQKQKVRDFFQLRIKKSFKYQTPLVLLFVALFVFVNNSCKADNAAIISAVQIKGINANDDFIEIYNTSCEEIDISGWKLRKRTNSGTESSIKVLSANTTISAKGYFLWGNADFANAIKSDQSTGATLSENYSIAFVDEDEIIDSITWGNNAHSFSGSHLYSENLMVSKVLKKDVEDNFLVVSDYFPKNSTIINTEELALCIKEEDEEEEKNESESKTYSDRIIINEIFPAPLKNSGLEEFVELYSSSDKTENLEGWYLKDRAGKTCALTGNIIDPTISRFLTLKNDADKKCTLALNDTQGEFLGLYNPIDLVPVFSVSYEGSAKKGRSYNFDGSVWSWSQFLTEGKENIFNSQPYGKVKIDEDVFANVYADFSVSSGDRDGDKIKISWDFGDGHKSSLAKTRHKYENVGTYNGSVKLSDGSEDVLQNFVVEVKKFPHPEVKIIAISANPTGADTGVEYITVQNKSKNKINLSGWSIATGWKKFINHPIGEDVIIKKDKSKEIRSDVSSFTLNNTKSKIQLRYPDGKVAYEVKYKKVEGIKEGEVYEKIKSGWGWIGGEKAESHQSSAIGNQKETSIVLSAVSHLSSEIQNTGKSDYEEAVALVEVKRENKLISASNDDIRIELLKGVPRVNETRAVREVDGIYFFTPQIPEKEHYAILFLKNIFSEINSGLNMIFNFIFK
ncbi:MAG: Microbial collagenase [Candidatus Moranbacteria bacterium GW2011_GWC2_37_73]|nr:MAG: S-layer-like protein array protein [Parcubacteria group bacterium GW2011_GWC1_36_108]KKQ39046.1 MAG: Microbial collagenase [Candidatus Moranbacteria bacterium GW2011_GWC2_37_73]HAR99883.1 hypothetical protein [Candidatus Moranbacteria bacterium]